MSPEDKAELEKVYGPLPELTTTTEWQYEKVSWPPRVEEIEELEPSDIKGYLTDYFVNQRWKSDPTHGGVLKAELRARLAHKFATIGRGIIRAVIRDSMVKRVDRQLKEMLGENICPKCGRETTWLNDAVGFACNECDL